MDERFVWERWSESWSDRHPGALSDLRRGINKEPGEEPALWPYYTKWGEFGGVSSALWSEHACLTAFGTHQQGQAKPVHVGNRSLAKAVRAMKEHGQKFSPEAIDRRMAQLTTASQPDELTRHLRSMVALLSSDRTAGGFDYTRLFRDLVNLQRDDRAGPVRRRWGRDYFGTNKKESEKVND